MNRKFPLFDRVFVTIFECFSKMTSFTEDLEPIATEEEASAYLKQQQAESEEEEMLTNRFSGASSRW